MSLRELIWKKSKDGLAAGQPEFIKLYDGVCAKQEKNKRIFIQQMRSIGVKAAHPNDGWHNRDRKEFAFSYPYFNDGVEVGDRVALGDYDCFVVVTVKEITGRLLKYYHYFPSYK